jgi:hypothetical protein
MSDVADLIAALPSKASGSKPDQDLLRTALVRHHTGFIPGDTSIVGGVLQWDPADAELGGVRQAYVYGPDAGTFVYDAADTTTAQDLIFCLVLIGGRRYKRVGSPRLKSVKSRSVTTPPADPDYGDAYLFLTGSWGSVGGSANQIGIWSSLGGGSWQWIDPEFGPPLYIEDEDDYVHWAGASGWLDGPNARTGTADSINLSEIKGVAASLTVRVQNQTTYAPPGSRVTGATPTMPKGGTAANINDNNDATTATTGTIGDFSGQPDGNRIIARLQLAAATDLIALEVRGLSYSGGAGVNLGLFYSTNSGASWTQAGSNITTTAGMINAVRTGTFAGVTDIMLAPTAGSYAANTFTIAGLNAFDRTVTASVGDAYIVAPGAFGIWAGWDGSVAICEAANTFTRYVPAKGDRVYDIALGIMVEWHGSAWIPAGGAIIGRASVFTASGNVGSFTLGDPVYAYSSTTAPTTSQNPRMLDGAGLRYRASSAGSILTFTYRADIVLTNQISGSGAATGDPVIALYRGSETSALDWKRAPIPRESIIASGTQTFSIEITLTTTAADDSDHTYFVAWHGFRPATGTYSTVASLTRRLLVVTESKT